MSKFARKNKILIPLIMLIMSMSVLSGCSSEDGNETTIKITDPTTEKVTTTKETTTKEVETTTKEPEVEYLRKGFVVEIETFDFFEGLVLEKGDIIYINDLYSGESDDYDSIRGSIAVALLRTFKMREEENELNSKYREEGSDGAEIPHSANYSIEYSGEKIRFVFIKKDSEHAKFDIVFMK